MRHTATTLALTALAARLLGGCLEGSTSAASQTAVVDLERIMSQSAPPRPGARPSGPGPPAPGTGLCRSAKSLGQSSGQGARGRAPRRRADPPPPDGRRGAAVQNAVNGLLLEEVKAWRKAHKAALVLPRRNVLDADASLTSPPSHTQGHGRPQARLPALPVVSVKLPGEKGKTPETPGQANHNAAPGAKKEVLMSAQKNSGKTGAETAAPPKANKSAWP